MLEKYVSIGIEGEANRRTTARVKTVLISIRATHPPVIVSLRPSFDALFFFYIFFLTQSSLLTPFPVSSLAVATNIESASGSVAPTTADQQQISSSVNSDLPSEQLVQAAGGANTPSMGARLFASPLYTKVAPGVNDLREKKRQLYLKDRELNQLQHEAVQRQKELNTLLEDAHAELNRREEALAAFIRLHDPTRIQEQAAAAAAAAAASTNKAARRRTRRAASASSNSNGDSDEGEAKSSSEPDSEDAEEGESGSADAGEEHEPLLAPAAPTLSTNSVVYQKELRRLSQLIEEQRTATESLVRQAHSELRKREAEITRRASDLKDRQSELVSVHMGITDEQQSEMAELLDKTRAWEQAKMRESLALQNELRAAEAEIDLWKAKFSIKARELEDAQECAEVHAAHLALALEAETQKRNRIEAEHRIALARGVDAVKRDASQLVAQAKKELGEEFQAKADAQRAAHEEEVATMKREHKEKREELEAAMKRQAEYAQEKLDQALGDAGAYLNAALAAATNEAQIKERELKEELEVLRTRSHELLEKQKAESDALLASTKEDYENQLAAVSTMIMNE